MPVAALVTTLASQGTQYLGALPVRARHRRCQPQRAWSACRSTWCWPALGTAGLPGRARTFLISGSVLGALFFGIGLLSDIRSKLAPKGGVGLFFGTFNPFHNTHSTIVRAGASTERGSSTRSSSIRRSSRACTSMPSARARSGSARLRGRLPDLREDRKADVERRLLPDRQQVPAARDAQGADRAGGRRGRARATGSRSRSIPRSTTARLPGRDRRDQEAPSRRSGCTPCTARIFGGMTVRQICDECGWIYPWRILRRDKVSATAIRAAPRA